MTKKQLKEYLQILQTGKYSGVKVFERDLNEFSTLARKDKDEVAIAYAEYYETVLKFRKNMAGEDSLKKLVYSLQLSMTHNEPRLEADCHNMLGIIMFSSSDEISALEHYEKAYEICKKSKLVSLKSVLANNIGEVYQQLGDYKQALAYFREAYQAAVDADYGPDENNRVSRFNGMNLCLMSIAGVHYKLGEYEEAFKKLSCIEGVKAGDYTYSSAGYAALYANVLLKMDMPEEANEYIIKVIEDAENQHDIFAMGTVFFELATVLIEKEYYVLAKRLIQALKKMCGLTDNVRNWCAFYSVAILYEKTCGDEQNIEALYERYYKYREEEVERVKQQKLEVAKNRKHLDDEIKRRTAAEERNRRLKRFSEHDPLTGMYNRNAITGICEKWFEDAKKRNSRYAISVLDIDDFRQYNDTYGPLQGDEVLREVSDVLTECSTKNNDVVLRYGGDEFFIVSRNKTDEELVRMLTDIRRALASRMINHDKSSVSQYVTVTQGSVNGKVSENQSLFDFIHLADNAMYKVKNGKKNALGFYRQQDGEFVFEQLEAARKES